MADLATFLRECAASGALIASICGVLVVPLLTWLAIRALAPFVVRMSEDAAWQAPLAAAAATIPGAMFLLLSLIGLAGAASSGCLNYSWGCVFFAAIVALIALAVCRSSLSAFRRAREVRALIHASQAPDSALQTTARRCRVRVRVLNYSEPFCALAGLWSPVVLISTQTLKRLNAEELQATLRHEHAHAARLDLLLGALVSFFTDLLPLPASDLVQAYCKARETAADERAIRVCAPQALASAIVRLAAAKPLARAAAHLIEDGQSVKQRIAALLDDRPDRIERRNRRIIAAASLAAIVAASVLPAALSALNFASCTTKGMHV